MRAHRDRPKCINACNYCRERKVKCSGDARCGNCVDHRMQCIYPKVSRRRRKQDPEGHHVLQGRIDRLEAVLNIASESLPMDIRFASHIASREQDTSKILQKRENGGDRSQVEILDRGHEKSASTIDPQIQGANQFENPNLTVCSNMSGHLTLSSNCATPETAALTSRSQTSEGRRQADSSVFYTPEEHRSEVESFAAPQNVNWEHHAPTSWLSICSGPGIAWITAMTGAPDFAKSARSLSLGWTRRLKLDPGMIRDRAPEPKPEEAWRFCKAYFEEAYDVIFGIIFRPAFESRLRQQYEEGMPDDPSWYALRNVVFASGCRILLSKDPLTTFLISQQQAWRYFENALSMHTELCTPTGLCAVQALALMSYYVEGLGSPALEYTFCSSAVRLAQAKGLHRQSAAGWQLSESEALHRTWLWWAIYCCDKHISKRSGRPSAIDDDEMSCQIPTKNVNGSSVDIEMFTSIIKHAQISARISRRLASVKALQGTSSQLIETIDDLARQLQEWYDALPANQKLKVGRNISPTPSTTRLDYLMYLHNAYHGSLMSIHTIFSYPWVSAIFGNENNPVFRAQMVSSTNALAEAARNIILATKYIGIDCASPHWLSFSYPMFSLINIFICLLKTPTDKSSLSDLALMDMVAGHFAHMEFVTSSELSFPFTREVAALARVTVSRAMESGSAGRVDIIQDPNLATNEAPVDIGMDFENMDAFNLIDLDMEGWNVFSSDGVDGSFP